MMEAIRLSHSLLNADEDPLAIVPDFPLEVFPKPYQDIIEEVCKVRDLDENLLGSAIFSVASSQIGLSRKLETPKGVSTACVFSVLVGDVSAGKSPAMNFATIPIKELEKVHQDIYKEKAQEYKEYLETPKKQREELPELFEPVEQHQLIQDATIESVIAALQGNRKGMLLFVDEILYWFKRFDTYRSGGDQQQWLNIWGSGMVKSQRISRRTDFVEDSFITVLGSIQPKRLPELFKNGMDEDGMFARLLFTFAGEAKLPTEESFFSTLSPDVTHKYCTYIRKLSNLTFEDGQVLTLSAGALDLFKDFYIEIQHRIHEEQDPAKKAVLGKLSQYSTRFALIIEMLEYSTGYEFGGSEVSRESMQKAIELVSYYETTYSLAVSTIQHNIYEQEAKEAKGGKTDFDWGLLFAGRTEMKTADIVMELEKTLGYGERKCKEMIYKDLIKVRHGVYRP